MDHLIAIRLDDHVLEIQEATLRAAYALVQSGIPNDQVELLLRPHLGDKAAEITPKLTRFLESGRPHNLPLIYKACGVMLQDEKGQWHTVQTAPRGVHMRVVVGC